MAANEKYLTRSESCVLYNYSGAGVAGGSQTCTATDVASYMCSTGMVYAAADNPRGSTGWVHVWSQSWGNTNTSWVSQIAVDVQSANGLYYRANHNNAISGKTWTRVWDSANSNLSSVTWNTSYLNAYAGITNYSSDKTYRNCINFSGNTGRIYNIKDDGSAYGDLWLNGAVFFNSSNKIGLFTSNPANKASLLNSSNCWAMDVCTSYGSVISSVYLAYSGGHGMYIGTSLTAGTPYALAIYNGQTSHGSGGNCIFYVGVNGNTGIGSAATSTERLYVNGSIRGGYIVGSDIFSYSTSNVNNAGVYGKSGGYLSFGIASSATGGTRYGLLAMTAKDGPLYRLTDGYTSYQIWDAGNFNPGNYLPLSGGTITKYLGKGNNYLIKPVAEFRTSTQSHTGCITITLPAGIGNTMVSLWVDVYNYVTNTSFSIHCGGYTYNNSTWSNNPFAMAYGTNAHVRFGHNGTSFVIYIGETNTSWSYPQISVRDVILGFGPSYANWCNDWTISFSTSVSNVTADITHYAYTTKNLTKSVVTGLLGSNTYAAYNSNGYVSKGGDTMSGALTFSQTNSTRTNGLIGTYDPNRAAAIWSMGSAYQIAADGLSFGSLYGAAYAYFGANYTFSGYSGGHSFVWAQAGSPTVALGNNVWTSGGFVKNGSNNSYVLLGGGGHAAVTGLSVNYANSAGACTTTADVSNTLYVVGVTSSATSTLKRDTSVTVTGGVLTTAGDQVISSDRTLKENFKDIAYSVEDIADAPAVTFDWKDGRGHSAGSIAQYWKPIIPELVHGEEGSMTLAYGQIGLVNSVIIARENVRLKEEVSRLSDEVSSLREELSAIKNLIQEKLG